MVPGKLPVPGRPTIWITVGQEPTALAVGAGWCCLDIFTLIYPFFLLSPSLWETARYRLKYCLKGLLTQNQPTNNQLPRAMVGWWMVQCRVVLLIWIIVWQWAYCACSRCGWGCLNIFYLVYQFFLPLSERRSDID